jgi:hypothetical protein
VTWPVAIGLALLVVLYLRSPVDLLPDRLGGVGLLDDLLVLGLGVWWVRKRLRSGRPAPRAAGNSARAARDPWDPWAVLGVAPGASGEEIRRAYREQMKRYHPDRVADLGREVQEVAHRRALDIQRAYEEIGRP